MKGVRGERYRPVKQQIDETRTALTKLASLVALKDPDNKELREAIKRINGWYDKHYEF